MVVTVDPKKAARYKKKCLTPKIVYQADVKNPTNDEKTFYLGVTGKPFKERFVDQTRGFKHPKYRNRTELSKYIWELNVVI